MTRNDSNDFFFSPFERPISARDPDPAIYSTRPACFSFPFPGVRAQELIADKRTPKKKEAQDKRSTCVIHAEAAASIFDQLQLNEDYSPYRSQMGAKVSDRGSYWARGLKLFLHLRAAKPTIILHQEVSL